MRNLTITNYPQERQRVTYPSVTWERGFSIAELDAINRVCREIGQPVRGTTFGNPSKEHLDKTRKSDLIWHRRLDGDEYHGGNGWIFDKLNNVIASVNAMYYGFDLNGFESFQFTEYRADEGGHYNWHMDMCMGRGYLPEEMAEPRKLSLTMMLSDPSEFDGGEFQINAGNEADAKTVPLQRGDCVLFPSFMIHRVKPVTRGVRRSLVVWVTGPKFT